MQTVIIVIIHVLIQPYTAKTLNMLDGVILLTVVLAANLNSFAFSRSSMIAIVVIFVIFPLLLSLVTYGKKYLPSFLKFTWHDCEKRNNDNKPKYM